VHGAIYVAMVGHGGSILADLAEVGGELVYVAGTIEEGVIGMKMEMGELCGHRFSLIAAGTAMNRIALRKTRQKLT
jgi:hypothetical protein